MWRRLVLSAGLTIAAAACAPAVGNTGSHASRNLDVLLLPEMTSAGVHDAYEAVTRLRPMFIKQRGTESYLLVEQTEESVYLDNVRLGGIESLRTVKVQSIQSISYLNPTEASNRLGKNHAGGVIFLSTL